MIRKLHIMHNKRYTQPRPFSSITMFHSKKKNGSCTMCMITGVIYGIIGGLVLVFSLIGAYRAHVLTDGVAFGTTSGSLAIIALVFSVFLCKKVCCCSCGMSEAKKK